MKVLCGPAAVIGEFCRGTNPDRMRTPLGDAWEGMVRIKNREPEDLHAMRKEADG